MITVVSGEPRSGTSLMMRLLEGLGLKVKGDDLIKGKKGKRRKNAEDLNPKGFYEVPGVVMKGIPEKDLEDYDNHVVKLITPALLKTSYLHIGRVIFCLRDPREIALSQEKLASPVEVAIDGEWNFAPKAMTPNYKRYANSICQLFMYIYYNANILYKTLFVDYHDVIFKTEHTLLNICAHLEIGVSKNTIKEAVALQDPSLYRSKNYTETDDKYFHMSMYLYDKLKKQEFTDEVFTTVLEFVKEESKEGVMWLDDSEFGTWVRMRANLYRSLITNNKKVRDKLVFGANTNRRPFRPVDCKFYRPIGKEYTIVRPKDVGDLTRSSICCLYHGKDMTREQCYGCWLGILKGQKVGMYRQHKDRGLVK
jgi:hypothetical protein